MQRNKKATLVFTTILFFAVISNAQNNTVYQLSFDALNNSQGKIAASSFQGKKVLITVFDAGNPDRNLLLSLDTLCRQNKNSLVVIAIPAADYTAAVKNAISLKKLVTDTLMLSYPVASISKSKKKAGAAQHSLLAWLTNKNQNNHFDADIDKPGEMFVLSEKGKLFARIKEPIPVNGKIMRKLLAQQVSD